jgi:hypothetical protein
MMIVGVVGEEEVSHTIYIQHIIKICAGKKYIYS